MGPARIPLSLDASRCDRCGRCAPVCPAGALRVGQTYIYVDWRSCDGCLACAKACETGAITKRAAAPPSSGAPRGATPRTQASRTAAPRTQAPRTATPRTAAPRTTTTPAATPPEWSLLEAWTLLAVLFAAFLAKDVLMLSEFVSGLSSETKVFARVAVLFGFYGVQVAVLWAFAWRRGLALLDAYQLRASGVSWRTRLGSAGLVVGLLVVVRLGAWGYGVLAQALGWDPPVREIADLTEVFGPTIWGLLLSIALVVIVAPVVEEVVFRGVLQGAFASQWGWRVAVVASAALFAFYHLTPWLFVPLFALGLACGWLAHTRRTLLPAISLHAAYNVLPVVIAFWMVW